MIQLTFKSLKL